MDIPTGTGQMLGRSEEEGSDLVGEAEGAQQGPQQEPRREHPRTRNLHMHCPSASKECNLRQSTNGS